MARLGRRALFSLVVVVLGCQKRSAAPPADCDVVAAHAVAFTLGNYAPAEERAPAIAALAASCRSAAVDRDQGACVLAARDVWRAAACAPALFPGVRVDGDCDAIAAKIGAMVAPPNQGAVPPEADAMATKVVAAVRTSCREDGWPEPFKACVLTSSTSELNACEKLAPADLKIKLAARITP
ncbi:MAG: hypothetical protein R3B06_30420 [Kofleriaceae bacterium]